MSELIDKLELLCNVVCMKYAPVYVPYNYAPVYVPYGF